MADNKNNVESIFGDLGFFKDILRKSGYKTIAFGIAEILDNSIDADATDILIIVESDKDGKVQNIGFMDNGVGMSQEILHKCLKVGTHFGGIGKKRGKYGFGLPGASFAFSDTVEVYTWSQSNSDEVKMVSLNLDNINSGIVSPKGVTLPLPYQDFKQKKAIVKWGQVTKFGPVNFFKQGTLVLWKGCERVYPKVSKSLIANHLIFNLSRMFRHFLTEDTWSRDRKFPKVNISIIHNLKDGLEPTVYALKPNDPLFIMKDHALSSLFSFKEKPQLKNKFSYKGSEIEIRFSLAPIKVKEEFGRTSPENTKNIGPNTGISIIREGRELDLDHFNFFKSTEERHRWWGCEILFNKEADDFFGVPANKQHVDQLKKYDKMEGDDDVIYPEDTPPEDMPVWLALDRAFKLRETLSNFYKEIRKPDTSFDPPPGGDDILGGGSDLIDDPDSEDEEDSLSGSREFEPEKVENAKRAIELVGLVPTPALIERFIKHKVVLQYTPKTEDSGFIEIDIFSGVCLLQINTLSTFYQNIISPLENSEVENSDQILRGVELLLLSYARCIDVSSTNRDMFKKVLYKWKVKVEECLRDYFNTSG